MRKNVFYILAYVFCLAGCNDAPSFEEEGVPQIKVSQIMFNIQMEKEVISFPQTKSMPDNTIPEPFAPSKAEGDPELNELCSTIEYVVFKEGNGVSVFSKHKQFVYDPSDLDADFGCIYDSLPQGNYTFYFIAHNSPMATLSESIFSFDEISDTFYKGLPLEIGVAEEINESIVLDRIVSRIEFMATDPITEAIKQFDMEIEGRAIQFDITDGGGIKAAEKETVTHIFTSEEVGISNKIHSFYTFVPSLEKPLTARLSAISLNDEAIRERQVKNIIPEKNKIIRYKGRLYSRSESDDTFQISIYNNGKWEETTDVELPDYE